MCNEGASAPGHSAAAGYLARSSKLPDFDGKRARMGMESCLITVTSPSGTAGHKASYVVPNATTRMRRLRNRSQNGAERCLLRWSFYEISFNAYAVVDVARPWLIRLVCALGCIYIRRPFMSSLSICQFFCEPQVPYHDTPIRSRNIMVGKLAMGHPGWCSLETIYVDLLDDWCL